MKKMTKSGLKKSADTLISMTTRMIGEMENEKSCDPKELEQLSAAFLYALSAVASMEKKAPGAKKETKKKEEKKVVGRICLPPVMEREE